VRALIVTNMYPSPRHPALGSFVRDQVEALRRIAGIAVEVFAFDPGSPTAYTRAAMRLRARGQFDIVHAHFGLTAWPALAAPGGRRVVTLHGTDLAHPRSRLITLGVLRFYDLVAAVSEPLARNVPSWAVRGRTAVLPAGVEIKRFRRIDRGEARAALDLDPARPYLLFPADPERPEKRYDRALSLARDVQLLTLRDVNPADVVLWINAANAVVVPSDRESFGLAALEALACDVPVLATPVGVASEVLDGIEGCYCAPFDLVGWRAALGSHLSATDPRVAGRARAERYSSDVMAGRVVEAWRSLG
jgi:glycosyltransferase involved in cell wall biosynthesis